MTVSGRRKKYILPTAVFVLVIAGILWIKIGHISLVDIIPAKCILYETYGFYCTGCGGTRAVMELLNGHLLRSFLYHPAVLYSAAIAVMFFVSCLIRSISSGKWIGIRIWPVYFYVLIGIIIVQCIVKNGLLIFFHYRIL